MTLQLLGFPDLVQRFATQARAATSRSLDFTVGSLFRALAEAQAGVGLWLQWLILDVLRQGRLATSIGSEVDTWVGDYGITRLPASQAVGQLTLSRFTTGLTAFVPVGATVRTADGLQSFVVGTDVSNPAWAGIGYTLSATTDAITVPGQALTGGAAGNVQAGTITVLTTAISGIDSVTNAAPFTGGIDAESDQALKARFPLFVESRSRGTKAAALYAVASLQQGLNAVVQESTGAYTVVVDDGTGAPSSDLLSRVYAACDAVRPLGVSLAVVAPQQIIATLSMVLTAKPGYAKANLVQPVVAALLAYVNSLSIGEALGYAHVAQVVLNVPGVANVQSIVLSGSTADVGGGAVQVVRTTIANIAVG